MTKGRILKGIGGFYTVQDEAGRLHTCRARGRLRSQGLKPLVGDRVEILEQVGEQDGRIENILPRKNAFVRPPVANVDQLILVLSASWPPADLLLYDKLWINATLAGVSVAYCINKCDMAGEGDIENLAEEFLPTGNPVLRVSAENGRDLQPLKAQLRAKVSGFAGQSGVGKSTLINALFPALQLTTGEKASRAPRGTHTTRHVELLSLSEGEGQVLDTPGFSLLNVPDILPEQLQEVYTDFVSFRDACRHRDCLHEPSSEGCAVHAAARDGRLHAGRYQRYLSILQELIENRRKRYD